MVGLTCLLLASVSTIAAPAGAAPPVEVILWFDTEDYLLPAADDATLRLCEMLTARDIRATFKIVGEKARVLERRGRRDVIEALRKHDIGYHSDFHSVHPTPTEYLAECDWREGVAEFIRREGQGAADVRRIFGVPTLSCYGQPGSSWGPQTVAALPRIGVAPHGVPCYVDEGDHVGLNGKPFWYAGALHVYHFSPNYTRMDLHDPAEVEPAKQEVAKIADRLRGEGGGLISIFYHPCEWVHREFWDGVNFSRGANPPREQWKLPPQRTAAETEAAFQRFGAYIDHIRALPGVRWVTASDLPGLYPDPTRTEGASEADVAALARRVVDQAGAGLDWQVIGPRAYSVADQFELLTMAVDGALSGSPVDFPQRTSGLLGPEASPPVAGSPPKLDGFAFDGFAFRDAVCAVRSFVEAERAVPARVFVGTEPLAPADFLVAMAMAWRSRAESGGLSVNREVTPGQSTKVLAERHVAEDTPGLFGGWVIHTEGFRAPKLMALARLQAWTLKPALRRPH